MTRSLPLINQRIQLMHCLVNTAHLINQILPQNNKTTKYEHLIPQLVAIEQDEKVKAIIPLVLVLLPLTCNLLLCTTKILHP